MLKKLFIGFILFACLKTIVFGSTIEIKHDCWIGEAYPTYTHGGVADVKVRKATDAARWGYLKFDCSSLSGNVTQAKLRVYCSSLNSGITVKVYEQDNNWDESTTWNTKPTEGAQIAAIIWNDTGWHEYDVTSYVDANQGGDISFRFRSASTNYEYVFNSSENGSNEPELVVTTNDSAYEVKHDCWIGEAYPTYTHGGVADVKARKATDAARWGYLKFDCSSLSGNVTQAKLRVYCSSLDSGMTVKVYEQDNNWDESTTWNTQPDAGDQITENIRCRTGWHEYNVTSYVDANQGGDISFRFRSASTNYEYVFNSSENGSNEPELIVTTNGNAYFDDFESHSNSSDPDYWVEQRGFTQNWSVQTDGTKVYRQTDTSESSRSLLHVFAKNATISGKFKINSWSGADARMRIFAKTNDINSYVQACVRNNGTAFIQERVSDATSLNTIDTESFSASTGTWYYFEVKVSGTSVTFKINGSIVASGDLDESKADDYGRVGLGTKCADVSFDDVSYIGDGIIYKGIDTYVFPDGDAEGYNIWMEQINSTTMMVGEECSDDYYTSTDWGDTWSVAYSDATTMARNLVKDEDSDLFRVNGTGNSSGDEPFIFQKSTNGGATWTGTTDIFGGNYQHDNCKVMSDALIRHLNGDLFFTYSEGDESESTMKTAKSTDDGVTWTVIDSIEYDSGSTWKVMEEGKVVDLPTTGHVKAYGRGFGGYLWECTSTNGGTTWGTPQPTNIRTHAWASFNIERDPYSTNTYYLVYNHFWFDGLTISTKIECRVSLAVNTNGSDKDSWQWVADLDDWYQPNKEVDSINESLDITEDYVFVSWKRKKPGATGSILNAMVSKIKKSDMNPTTTFPPFHYYYYAEKAIQSPGMEESLINIPVTFELAQNYPNPFNPVTNIQFELPQSGLVRLDIYNIMGQHVRTLIDKEMSAGSHNIQWDAMNDNGIKVVSGLYFCTLKAFDKTKKMKMMMIK